MVGCHGYAYFYPMSVLDKEASVSRIALCADISYISAEVQGGSLMSKSTSEHHELRTLIYIENHTEHAII